MYEIYSHESPFEKEKLRERQQWREAAPIPRWLPQLTRCMILRSNAGTTSPVCPGWVEYLPSYKQMGINPCVQWEVSMIISDLFWHLMLSSSCLKTAVIQVCPSLCVAGRNNALSPVLSVPQLTHSFSTKKTKTKTKKYMAKKLFNLIMMLSFLISKMNKIIKRK